MKLNPREHVRLAACLSLCTLMAMGCGKEDTTPTSKDMSVTDMAVPDEGMVPDADAGRDADMMAVDAGVDAMADMPDMPDTLSIPGLSAPVQVRLDEHGVVFLNCETDNDCFAAQGYIHAKHRFFAMDLLRRQTLGKLAAGLGQLALDFDKSFRHLMTTPDGERLEKAYLDALEPDTRTALDAYANGVNAFLADQKDKVQGAEFSDEYDFPLLSKEIPAWTPEDSIAVYMQLAYQLGERSQAELENTRISEALGADVASDIFTVRTGTQSSVFMSAGQMGSPNGLKAPVRPRPIAAAWSKEVKPALGAIDAAIASLQRTQSLVFGPKSDVQGSNNWVLDPSRTQNGNPLLANDPHLALANPSLWHYIVLDSKTEGSGSIHVAGASIPAVPGILIGHNETLAWGTTTARLDMSDVYIETLNEAGDAVIFNGEEVPLLQKDYTFDVYLGQPVTETLEWVPHHGPLISKDVANRRGVSVKWVAHQGGEDLNYFLKMMKAGTVQEGTEALQDIRGLNQSWVLADDTGEIAWYPHSHIPKRPWGSIDQPTWMALPGDGSAEWDGFITGDDTPHIRDPESGLLITANSDFDGSFNDGDPFNDEHTIWQWIPVQGFRFDRILSLIDDIGNAHTPETMLEIQADVRVEFAAMMLPDLIDSVSADALSPEAQAVLETLSEWSYTCPTGLDGSDPMQSMASQSMMEIQEAAGCAAFHVLLKNLGVAIFADELEELDDFDPRIKWYELQRGIHQVISSPENLILGEVYFDDVSTSDVVETREQTLSAALEATSEELEDLFGASAPDMWLWGRIHTVLLESFFMQAGIESYNAGGQANDGGFETVDVAPPRHYGAEQDTYSHNHGASLRTVIELDKANGFKTWYQLPGGQIHKQDDPRYQSLLADWLENKPNELPFKLEEVRSTIDDEVFEIAPE